MSSEVYAVVAACLAERLRVVTFDRRGHGRSTIPGGALGYELLADETAELIGALDFERPFVGGLIAGGTSLAMGGNERARSETRVLPR